MAARKMTPPPSSPAATHSLAGLALQLATSVGAPGVCMIATCRSVAAE